ncbi:hypothetical protein Y032_0347g3158 [Ancylostoma ceylanicum]|uniref:BPTI/Kunitz inhibitor domain-containing protein n=1 Tax=Ancylostoma ceylanicum TaxID=53326 RepID=A0A016RX77_9BILA|nr:hypothetical protein Y032_0347g3158 [Ancylostoma ceylanicum]
MIIAVYLLLSEVAHASDLGGVLCRLPKDEGYECGIVGAAHSAFYFDADIGECIEFMFKGCGGNQNRFASKEDCLQGCKSLNRICQASLNAGNACGIPPQTRYYYDAPSKLCRPFTFTGCGGNENNFKTKGECTQFCSAENFVCGSPLEDRNNRRLYSKEFTWSFNYKTGDCEMKEHAIGDEQWNAFASQEQCIDFCVGTCPNHLEVHYNTLTGQPQLCDAKANTGCPLGYECVQTSPFAAVCCRTKPTCPAAESIALLERICFSFPSK